MSQTPRRAAALAAAAAVTVAASATFFGQHSTRTPAPAPSTCASATPSPSASAAPIPSVPPIVQSSAPASSPAASPTATPVSDAPGVPAGLALKASGSLTVTTNGAVISGLDIKGTLTINADNVTVKNTRVSSGSSTSSWSVVSVGGTGDVLDHVTVVGGSTEGAGGITGSGTFNAVDVSRVENGFVPGSNTTITGAYVHDLYAPGSPHYDGIQIDGGQSNVTVSGSTIDLGALGQTSAVMVDNYFGPAKNITITGNRLSGGGYTVYADGQFNSNAITVTYSNNKIGKGQWGYDLLRGSQVTWSGNTDIKTGAPIS